jgi:hypothetical protein
MVRHAELAGQAKLAGQAQAKLTGQAPLTGNFSRTARQAELSCICESPPRTRRMVMPFGAARKPESQARLRPKCPQYFSP